MKPDNNGNTGAFYVCEKACDRCLLGKNPLVSPARVKALLEDVASAGGHFSCHRATMDGRDVSCRSVHERQIGWRDQVARRLGVVVYVDPDGDGGESK